jgi:hypothetical protein
MRGRHSGANSQQQITKDPSGSKSAVTFALPMYTVGIAVFFIYTCFKVYRNHFILSISSYIFI